jgi:hypothetical protein
VNIALIAVWEHYPGSWYNSGGIPADWRRTQILGRDPGHNCAEGQSQGSGQKRDQVNHDVLLQMKKAGRGGLPWWEGELSRSPKSGILAQTIIRTARLSSTFFLN